MTEPITSYTLTMSPEYVSSWNLWEAVRELVQNSIDQCNADPQSCRIFEYDSPWLHEKRDVCDTELARPDGVLTIGTTRCQLSPQTLLLGVSTRRNDPRMIGQFGEGYKLALLVLTRSLYEVVVRNNDRIWKPRFEYSETYNSHVLTIDVYPNPDPVDGVFFDIHGVSPDAHGKLHENYLMDMPVNRILEEEHFAGKVYVNGLFVSKVEGLRFGYNFSADRIRLERDRNIAPTFEVCYEASRLWEQHGDDAKLYDNMKAGFPDVQYVEAHLVPKTTNEYIVGRYLAEHDDAIPVSTETEARKFRGHKTCIVPAVFSDLVRRFHEFRFGHEGTPTETLEVWFHQWGGRTSKEGKREFDKILEESKGWR